MRKTFQTIAILSVGTVAMIAGGQRGLEKTASAQAGAAVSADSEVPRGRVLAQASQQVDHGHRVQHLDR